MLRYPGGCSGGGNILFWLAATKLSGVVIFTALPTAALLDDERDAGERKTS